MPSNQEECAQVFYSKSVQQRTYVFCSADAVTFATQAIILFNSLISLDFFVLTLVAHEGESRESARVYVVVVVNLV